MTTATAGTPVASSTATAPWYIAGFEGLTFATTSGGSIMAAAVSPPADAMRGSNAVPRDQRALEGRSIQDRLLSGSYVVSEFRATAAESSSVTAEGQLEQPTLESRATTPLSSVLGASDVEFLDQELDWEELLHLSPVEPRIETPTSTVPAGVLTTIALIVGDCLLTVPSTLQMVDTTAIALSPSLPELVPSFAASAPSFVSSDVLSAPAALPNLQVCGDASGGDPGPRVECPGCERTYAAVRGLKKHVVKDHKMRYEPRTKSMVPFRTKEELNRAWESCRRGMQGSARCRAFRASTAAANKNDTQETRPEVAAEGLGGSSEAAAAESRIPGLDSGTGLAEAAAGKPPASPLVRRPVKFPTYEVEDISEPEDGPPVPPAMSFEQRQPFGRAPPLSARTAADPEIRGRVLQPPSQEGNLRVPPVAPHVFAPILPVSASYYWPMDLNSASVPPPANFRYMNPVNVSQPAVVTAPAARPEVYMPPLVPPPRQEMVSRERGNRLGWVPEGAPANANAM